MKKKFVLGLTSLVVASAVAIGGTLAFMTAQAGPMTNNFKAVGDGITGQLREKTWDHYDFNQYVDLSKKTNPDGLSYDNKLTPADLSDPTKLNDQATIDSLGITKAQAMAPGKVIPKDPTLMNTSANNKAYMAIKVVYSLDASKALFDNTIVTVPAVGTNPATTASLASLTINSGWQKLDSNTKYYKDPTTKLDTNFVQEEYYIYAGDDVNKTLTKVDTGAHTAALFNNITINQYATYDNVKAYADPTDATKNFNIKVMGAAVQTTDLGADIQTLTAADDNAVSTARVQLVKTLDGIIY